MGEQLQQPRVMFSRRIAGKWEVITLSEVPLQSHFLLPEKWSVRKTRASLAFWKGELFTHVPLCLALLGRSRWPKECEENEISLLVRLEGLPQACCVRNVGRESPESAGCACRTVCGMCWASQRAGRGPLPLTGTVPWWNVGWGFQQSCSFCNWLVETRGGSEHRI